jgi:hypothetical protein
LKGDEIAIFFGMEAGNFSSGEHRVDHFKEGLILDFGVSQDESDRLAHGSSQLVKTLDVFLEVLVSVTLGQRDLEEDLLANEG